jgi:Ca2+-binding RTX toxin-like protein
MKTTTYQIRPYPLVLDNSLKTHRKSRREKDMNKIRKILALVIVGILLGMSFYVVLQVWTNELEAKPPNVFVEDRQGNQIGHYDYEKRDDGKFDLDIWFADSVARIDINGLINPKQDLLVKFDFSVEDLSVGYVVYVDPIEMEQAIITLPRNRPVSEILFSEHFDHMLFKCNEWQSTNIPFWEEEDCVIFEVEHFSAYGVAEKLTSFIVTTTEDSGEGSLRQAIINSNTNPGLDEITFNIPADDKRHFYYKDDELVDHVTPDRRKATTASEDSKIYDVDPDFPFSWWSILPTSALPIIIDPVIIDGYTQMGAKENSLLRGNDVRLKIELDGSNAKLFPGGLHISAGNSVVRGLVIHSFGLCGVQIDKNGDNVIEGNFIGTDISGTIARGNFIGVNIYNSSGNRVGGISPESANIILGNHLLGIFISGENAKDNAITGNYIGTKNSITADLENGASGVWVSDRVETDNMVQNNLNVEKSTELIFLDPSVENYYFLIEELLSNEDSSTTTFYTPGNEVIILEKNRDGIEQITEILSDYSDVGSIHIFSHGSMGSLTLGSTYLSNNNLDDYAKSLYDWRNSLIDRADILLYGCEVAKGEQGNEFIDKLSELTGADIAASDDPTGSAELGGDWELEVSTGDIESANPLSDSTKKSYNHLLGENVYTDLPLADYIANPKVSQYAKQALVNGFRALATKLGEVNDSQNFTSKFMDAVPGLLDISDPGNPVAPGFGALLGDFSLAEIFEIYVADDVDNNFTVNSSLDSLEIFLDNLDEFNGLTILVDEVDTNLVPIGGTEYEMVVDFIFSVGYVSTYKFDLGRNADVLGLSYNSENMPDIDLYMGFSLDLTFGTVLTLTEGNFSGNWSINDTKVETINSDFFIRNTSLYANADIDESGLYFDLQIGFLEIKVENGSFTLHADVKAEFNDPNLIDPITLAELTGTPVDNLTGVSINGSSFISAILPVTVKDINNLGFNTTFDNLTLFINLTGDPFGVFVQIGGADDPRTAPTIELSLDFEEHLKPFNTILPDGVLGLLAQLKGWFGTFAASQIFSAVDVPFADGHSLANVLDFFSGFDQLVSDDDITLTDEDGMTSPNFTSLQTFAVRLSNALGIGLGAINPYYDRQRHELTFNIQLNPVLPPILEIPIDFNFDLGVLGGIQTNIEVQLNVSVSFDLMIGIDLRTPTEIGVNPKSADYGLRALINHSSGSSYTPSDGQLMYDAKFKLTVGSLGGISVNVTANSTSDNTNINDLADDVESAINFALADKNIEATIQVKILSGDRLGFFTTNTSFLKIQNNSADKNESAGGFELLGFWDGQVGSTSPIPLNGVLSGNASFDLTVGLENRTVTVEQDTNNANLDPGELPTDKNKKINRLLEDLQTSIDNALGEVAANRSVIVSRVGDGFLLVLSGHTPEKFLRVNNPNDVAAQELGIPDDQMAAEVRILGDRSLFINGTKLSSDVVSNGIIHEDVNITLKIDNELVKVTVHAANGREIGFVCNQFATGNLTAQNNVTDVGDYAPGMDITFKLTINNDSYVISIYNTSTIDNLNMDDLVDDINDAFASTTSENGSTYDIRPLITATKDATNKKIMLTPTNLSHTLRISGMGTTQDNENLLELVNDLNEALSRVTLSEGTRLDRIVVAGAIGNDTDDDDKDDEFRLTLSIPSALKDWLNITHVSGSDKLGFVVTSAHVYGPRTQGRLTDDAEFTLTLEEGGGPESYEVTITSGATSTNSFITDLVDDINTALESVTILGGGSADISSRIIAGLINNRLTLFATNRNASLLKVTNTDTEAEDEIGLSDGVTALARENRGRLFIRNTSLTGALDLIVNTNDNPALEARFGFVGIEIDTINGTLDPLTYGDNVAVHGGVSVSLGGISSLFEITNFSLSGPATFGIAFDNIASVDVTIPKKNYKDIINLTAQFQFEIDLKFGSGNIIVGNAGNRLTLSTPGGERLRITVEPANSAAVDLGFKTGQQTGAFYLSDLADAISDLDILDLIVDLSISGSGNLTLKDINLQLPGIIGGLAAQLIPDSKIIITLEDFTNISTLNVTGVDMGAIADGFDDLNFSSIISALRNILSLLYNFSWFDFLDEPLPILGITLNETLDYITQFLDALEALEENPASIVQDLDALLKEALGLPADSNAISLSLDTSSSNILRINLSWNSSWTGSLSVTIDLFNLLGISMPSGLEDLVNLSGAAGLEAEFSIETTLGLGIDLDDLTLYIYDNTGLKLEGYANASNVNFIASLGPFGLFITGGHAVFNEDGDPNNTNPAYFHLEAFPDPNPGTEGDKRELFDFDFQADLAAGIGAILPCYFPTASNFIGNLDFNVSIALDLLNPEELDVSANLNSAPDFTNLPSLDDFNLIDSLLLIVEGVDLLLAFLENILDGEFGEIDLPLIGDELSDAADFIENIRGNVIPKLRDIIENAPQKAIELIQKGLFNSLGPGGINLLILDPLWHDDGAGNSAPDYRDVQYKYPSNATELQFNLWLGGNYYWETPEIDFGLPGLGLEMDGGINVSFDWNFLLVFGISLEDGFYFDTTPWDEFTDQLNGNPKPPQVGGQNITDVIAINLAVGLPESITGKLLFLQLDVENRDITMEDPDLKSLLGWFSIDVEGGGANERLSFAEIPSLDLDFSWGVQADIDLDLTLGIVGGGKWPSIVSEFYMRWGLGDGIYNGSSDPLLNHYKIPWIQFKNVGLNLGSFFSDFLGPIVETIQEITEPIQPLVDILTAPIPVISDLAGEDITLIDIAGMFGVVDPAFIYALADLITLINSIPTDAGDIIIYFGDFSVGGDGTLDLRDENALNVIRSSSPKDSLSQILRNNFGDDFGDLADKIDDFDFGNTLDDALSGSSASQATKSFASSTTKEGGGWKFPLFTDAGQIFGLLLGRDADIIIYDMPKFTFDFTYSQFFPIWDGLGAEITGSLGVIIDLSFGYDTYGIRKFAEGGFRHPLDLLKGFYVGDLDLESGADIPEVTIYGSLTGAAVLNLVVAKVGVGGGVYATVDFNLNDPDGDGKVRIEEIWGNILNGFKQLGIPLGLICIFDVSGRVEARLFAFVEFLWGLWEKTWYFGPSIPLIEFSYTCPHDPILAKLNEDTGELRLNMGEFAKDRLYGDNRDIGEEIHVRLKSGNTVYVWAPKFGIPEDDPQEYSGVKKIVASGGEGNDIIDLERVSSSSITAELRGGTGNDVLIAGKGKALLYGGLGDDILIGGNGDDELYGEEGNDKLIGNGGNDLLVGDTGDDVLNGDAQGSYEALRPFKMREGAVAGEDILLGGKGADMLAGGPYQDVLRGEDGKDQIWGDATIEFEFNTPWDYKLTVNGDGTPNLENETVNVGNDHITGDGDPDIIFGGGGDDYISGGGGPDLIYGDDGADMIYGDSSFKFEDNELQMEGGEPKTIFPFYGTAAGDTIYGGGGDDDIFGEDGNDEIYGDAGEDLIYGYRGSDIIYGGDNDDDLYGGTGNDRMFGNAGDDLVKGEADNDVMFGDDGEVQLVPNQLTLNYNLIRTINPGTVGNDVMDGNVGDDILLGGPGEDTMNGSSGNDILIGDNGEFDFTFYSSMGGSLIDLVQSTDLSDGNDDNLYGGDGDDIIIGGAGDDDIFGDADAPGVDGEDIIMGDNGRIDFVPDPDHKRSDVALIETTDNSSGTGGDDEIDGSENADIILGGVCDDDIIGGLDDDILLGDNGKLDYDTGDGDLSTLDLIITTDNIIPAPGGVDNISGGEGNDTVLGGKEGDNIWGDDTLEGNPNSDPGEDILIGDQGQIVFENGIITLIEATDSADSDGGADTIEGNEMDDIIIGGVLGDILEGHTDDDIMIGDEGLLKFNLASGSGGDDDPETLDLIETTDPTLGDVDTIEGNEGDDIIFGCAEGDDIWGYANDDFILGDFGKITMPGEVIDLIETIYPTTGGSDTIEGNDGEDIILGGPAGDDIWGNADYDIILGDNGKITMPDEVIELIETTDPSVGGSDTIEGNDARDIILGGADGDYIWGNDGEDVILGDNGKVTMPGEVIELIETTDPAIGGSDTIEGNEDKDIILGGAYGDDIWGNAGDDYLLGDNGKVTMPGEVVELIETTDPAIGGSDTIEGNDGDDVILGGAFGDDIWGNDGNDIILGDNGKITMPGEVIDLVETTDPAIGGSDTIEGNADEDLILGGADGDDIWGHDADDILIGDNGKITMPDEVIELIETTDSAIGGSDTIEGNDDDDIILGGAFGDWLEGNADLDIILGDNGKLDYVLTSVDGSEPDPSTLDLIIATFPNDGGNDTILGGTGNDIAYGGTDGDIIYGNEDNDLLFGDHAKVERKPYMLLDLTTLPVPTFTFIAIYTQAGDGGDGDLMHGNTGEDIMLGQQGDDLMYGDEDDDDMTGGHNVVGGIDELDSPPDLNDIMDGGSEDDVMAGDNAEILRRTDTISPRIRALNGETLYDIDGNADVTATHQPNPSGARGRDITLLDHSNSPTPNTFGNDYMAGGPHEDVMFGELGDDLMQGDASVMETISKTDPSVENADDGDDYIEGNGGDDLIYGNYGQDDIVGGSSELFGLTDSNLRPDGKDTILGGAGTRIARYDLGDESDDGHAKDSDYILGDNGNIFRIVGTNGANSGNFLSFTYDNYGNLTIIPRAIQLLDYTPGGNASDIGDDDLIHGEASDDLIHGMVGNDVIFGEGQDDDIYGQTGHDRLYGGNGQDGMLGDDGKVLTSRNGEIETLYGLTKPFKEKKIKMPGPFIGAWVDIEGRLKKVADLAAFEYGGNDILYGGLGNDWMHGGAGDDGMSGAEALPEFYNSDPITNTTPLPYDPVTRKISFYDADNPRTKITDFFLNFEAVDGNGSKVFDGKDRMFGDNGHDWLVGGTMNDRLFGGLGNDVLNADDNHDSQGGLNNEPDSPEFADRDFVFGGCGLDVMIFNTGGDRVFDWIGEFNSYIAPYAPFGYPETDRLISPHTVKFLMALGEACGADQSLIESDGELGLADQKDPRWGDQHGGPRDPQAGNLPATHRDTMGEPEDDR